MTLPTWYPDERAHAGPEHLAPDYVAAYDRKSGTDPAADVAHLRALGLGPSHTLVDFGAGTGAVALAVAPFCRRVVAVDVSAAMLTHLRARASALGIGNIECVQQGFLSYEHRDEPADFVYTRHALHHLPDFWKTIALARIAALLCPGGVFYLRDLIFACEPDEVGSIVAAWLARASPRPDLGWTRSELETHLRDEHSTFSWLLEPMLVHAGFAIQQADHAASRLYSAYTCLKRP